MRRFSSDLTHESINVFIKVKHVEDLGFIADHYGTTLSKVLTEILDKVDLDARVKASATTKPKQSAERTSHHDNRPYRP